MLMKWNVRKKSLSLCRRLELKTAVMSMVCVNDLTSLDVNSRLVNFFFMLLSLLFLSCSIENDSKIITAASL